MCDRNQKSSYTYSQQPNSLRLSLILDAVSAFLIFAEADGVGVELEC